MRIVAIHPIRAKSAPTAWVASLDLAVHWKANPDRLYMAMTGFFDESGTHGAESPVVIVAGFIASTAQWAAYERDLATLLDEYGVKKFHAKDLRGHKGDFKGWPTARRATFTSRFLKLADDHLACGLATVLSSDSYRLIYRSGQFVRTARPDTQYGVCVRAALWKSIVFMKDRQADWPLNFVFETSGKEGDAIRVFGEMKDSLLPEYSAAFGSITFDTKEALPLAVADSLAYSMFRMSAGYSKHPTEPNACVVGPADPPYYVQNIPLSRTLIDEDTLARWRDDLCR